MGASDPAALPALHIRPARGWLNDPNGMVRRDGVWHVFFQHNPARAQHGDIHWGHVSSPDLVTWTEHPVAFGPTPGGPDAGGCWSGAFVPWGEAAVAYTAIVDDPAYGTVCVRYARDPALDHWSEPVVVAQTPAGVGEMRDPFFFEWAGERYALLGAGLTDGTPVLLLFSCADLGAWTFLGEWLRPGAAALARAADAQIWECPQLVEIDGSWVLVVSIWAHGETVRAEHVVGGLETDARGLPRFVPRVGGPVDLGSIFYAPQILAGGSSDGVSPLLLGWLRQEPASDDAGPDAVSGCLTLPRRLRLDGDRLIMEVDPAVRALVGPPVELGADGLAPAQALVTARALEAGEPGRLVLSGVNGPVEVHVLGEVEVWVDGEVVEIYDLTDPTNPPVSIRQDGTTSWRVEAYGLELAVAALTLPARARARA